MRIKKQMGIVFNLDKCLGCQTCTIACKNVWTNREGAEYMFWNNVETKPGVGYPREWENQDKYRGGWKQQPGKEEPKLNQASRFWEMINLFYNPVLPQMDEYYGKGPFTFTYEDLHSEQPTKVFAACRPAQVDDHRGRRHRPHLRRELGGQRRGHPRGRDRRKRLQLQRHVSCCAACAAEVSRLRS